MPIVIKLDKKTGHNKQAIFFSLPLYLFASLLLFFLPGCASEYNLATQQQESLIYGTEKEVAIGDAVARQVEANYKLVADRDINDRCQRILDRIAEVSDRKDVVYSIRVIDEDPINAVSLPGGYVYIFKGLVDKIKTDDQLAGVIAHEVGHITARHAIKRLQASYGYMLLQVAAIQSGSGAAAQGVNALYTFTFLAYSRQDEFEADRLAVKYARKTGYDPKAMTEVLELIKNEEAKGPLRPVSYLRTHPYINERVAALNQEITGRLQFRDYLNLTGGEE